MRIVAKTRNHMPMQVRHLIAEARQIHLVRLVQLAQHLLDPKDDMHHPIALGRLQVGHFRDVAGEHHPQKARISFDLCAHHPALRIAPQHDTPVGNSAAEQP